MRAPRYQFPEQVRSTTRTIASKMSADGTNPETPEELESWLATRPELLEPLSRGGYGTAFTAHDLHPLLLVFMGKAATPAPVAAKPRSSPSFLLLGGLMLLAAIGALIFLL